jgi:uncharacterized membrane protein HdeD (DUF308 family)
MVVERKVRLMKEAKKFLTVKIIVSILFIILGVITIMKPVQVVSIVTWILGIASIVAGVVFIVIDISTSTLFLRSGGLLQGVIYIMLGVALIAYPKIGNYLLPLTVGAFLIADSIMRMQIGHVIAVAGGRSSLYIIAVLTLILGIVCLFNPMISSEIITTFLGIMLIVEAASSLIDSIYIRKYMKEISDSIIDV